MYGLRPRWKKVLRDLWGNKTRTLLAVIAIAVGVAAVGTISGAQLMITRDLGAAYAAINPPAAVLSAEPFDDELVDVIRSMPEVAEAEGRRRLAVRVRTGPDQWQSVELFALDDFAEQRIDLVSPQQGAWPPPDKEVLIERNSLGLVAAGIGDSLLVETPDGKQRELRIAGTTHHLLRPPAQFTGLGSGYITFETMEWLGEPREYDQLRFTLAAHADDHGHAQEVAEQVRDKVEKGGYEVLNTFVPVPGRHPANDAIEPILLLLGVLGYLTLFLSGFLVVNTISALLGQQVRQIGVMKSIGATSASIFGLYVAMVLILGLLALLVAVPLAAAGALGLASFVASIANFDIVSFPVPPEILALEIAAALLVPTLAALLPIRFGTRLTVREAISGAPSGQGVARPAREPARPRLALPRPLLISLRNSLRRRGRLALTLSMLTLGGGIFIAVFTVRVSLLRTFDDAIAFRDYDVQVRLERPYRQARVEATALELPDVVAAESWGFAPLRRIRPDDSESDTIQTYGVPAATTQLRPLLLEGRWLRPDDERAVVINTDLLNDEPDLRIGDTLRLKIGEREVDWRIVGLIQGVLAGPDAYINYPAFAYETRDANQASLLQVDLTERDPATQLRVGQQLEEAFKRAGIDVSQIKTTAQVRAETEARFAIIVVFLFIMAALIALVGGLGLMGTMSMNVLERTREIGVMRAIGARDRAILLIVIAEGVLVGLASWALGAVLAYPLSQALSAAVGASLLESPLNYRFALEAVAYWMGGAVALAALASLLPAWRAARLSIRDVLAYE
jgi:putative ABC transport system permease protein